MDMFLEYSNLCMHVDMLAVSSPGCVCIILAMHRYI